MLAHTEIRTDPLPFTVVARRSEPRRFNNLLEGGNLRHLAPNEHAFFVGDRESHIYRMRTGISIRARRSGANSSGRAGLSRSAR